MKVNKVLKSRVNLFVASSVFIVIAVIVSLIFIKNSDFVKSDVNFDINNLRMIYNNNENSVDNPVSPMNFEDGKLKIEGDSVEIVNNSEFSTSFSFCVQQIDTSSNNLTTDKLYYVVNDEGGILGDTNGCIYTGKVKGNDSVTFTVKIWPGADLIDNNDLGKQLNLKFYLK